MLAGREQILRQTVSYLTKQVGNDATGRCALPWRTWAVVAPVHAASSPHNLFAQGSSLCGKVLCKVLGKETNGPAGNGGHSAGPTVQHSQRSRTLTTPHTCPAQPRRFASSNSCRLCWLVGMRSTGSKCRTGVHGRESSMTVC